MAAEKTYGPRVTVMLGVKTTENIVQSPIGQKLQQLVNQEIDSYLNKLTKEK